MDEEQLKEKYMQFKALQEHMEQLSQHLQMMTQQQAELEISKNAIKELGKADLESDFLAPIADGIFVKGSLKDSQKVIINVGYNVTVEKTLDEAIGLLEKQQQEIAAKIGEAEELLQEFNQQAMKIYREVEEAQKE